jgi:DnaJ-class molecular chaperone
VAEREEKEIRYPCPTCRATGLVRGRPCKDCKGRGAVKEGKADWV